MKLNGEELTGPEYASRWIEQNKGVECLTETMVLAVEPGPRVIASSARHGLMTVEAGALVLAMGCRERTRGALGIPGTRPAGAMTAGTAQRLINIDGYLPGRRIAVLGSGDIGMIMARRLQWEGAEVVGVYEMMPYLSGLRRNYVQCLLDCEVPLYLGHTVFEVKGQRRLTGITVAPVDDALCPVTAQAFDVEVDTLLLSVGLIPENELTRLVGAEMDPATGGPLVDNRMQTSVPGVFAAGNVVQVHDLADDVSLAGGVAGAEAARQALRGRTFGRSHGREVVRVLAGENVRCVVPQWLRLDDAASGEVELMLRVRSPIEAPCLVQLLADGQVLSSLRLRYARPGEMVSFRISRAAGSALKSACDVMVAVVAEDR